MIFRSRERVEEDLERIRRANRNLEEQTKDNFKAEEDKKSTKEKLKGLTFKDYIAMVIAIFSIVIPYILIFTVILGLFILIIYFLILK